MSRALKIGTIAGAVTAALLAGLLVGAPAQATPTVADAAQVGNVEARNTADYWLGSNGRNMRNAQPLRQGIDPRVSASNSGSGSVDGDEAARRLPASPLSIGRVFFTGSDGKPYWCTGTALRSQNSSVVATAGQCAYDPVTNSAVENLAFVPAYVLGAAPLGIYVVKETFTHYDWTTYEDWDRNYAFLTVYNGVHPTRVNLGRLGDLVGGLNLAGSTAVGTTAVVRGYPAGGWPAGFAERPPRAEAPVNVTFRVTEPSKKLEEGLGIRAANPFASSIGSAWLVGNRRDTLAGITFALTDDPADGSISVSPQFDQESYEIFESAAAAQTGPIG